MTITLSMLITRTMHMRRTTRTMLPILRILSRPRLRLQSSMHPPLLILSLEALEIVQRMLLKLLLRPHRRSRRPQRTLFCHCTEHHEVEGVGV